MASLLGPTEIVELPASLEPHTYQNMFLLVMNMFTSGLRADSGAYHARVHGFVFDYLRPWDTRAPCVTTIMMLVYLS